MVDENKQPVRVALVGCGRIAQRHAKVLSEIDGLDLCAVCDVDKTKAIDLGLGYGAKHYFDMERMMECSKPDIVAICTPSGMHADHVCALACYGANIIVEKPMALTLSDVDRMVETCAIEGVRLCTVKQNRYNVAVQHAKKAVDGGHIGKIRLCSIRVYWSRKPEYYLDWHGQWDQAGGVLANQTIHHIDLMQWFCGQAESVYAHAVYRDYTNVEIGLVGTVLFESGTIGTVECTTLAQPVNIEGSMSILGDEGTIIIGGVACNRITTWCVEGVDAPTAVGTSENPSDVYGYGHKMLYEDILRRLETGEDWPVSWFEGRKSLEIVTAMYESVETGRPVRLNDRYRHVRLGK